MWASVRRGVVFALVDLLSPWGVGGAETKALFACLFSHFLTML